MSLLPGLGDAAFRPLLKWPGGKKREWARLGPLVPTDVRNFVDPFIWAKLLDGIREYLRRHDIPRVSDLTGTIDTSARENQWISS